MIDLFFGFGLETRLGLTANYYSAILAPGNFLIIESIAVVPLLSALDFEMISVS